MKLTGVHIAILVALAVIGFVVYGGYRYRIQSPPPVAADSEVGTMAPVLDNAQTVPKIVVEPDKVLDLGVVPRTGKTPTYVKVHNKGNAVLEITAVRTTCGCTSAKINEKAKLIKPGGFSEIEVSVDPKRIQGFESRKTMTISSNDPSKPRYDVDVVAKIDPEFSIDPPQLNLGKIRKGGTIEKQLLFRQLSDEVIEIKDVRTVGSGLEVGFVRRPENEWVAPNRPEYFINVKLTDDVPQGNLSGRVSIMSTCSRLPNYFYMVHATIESFYEVEPKKSLVLRPDKNLVQTVSLLGKEPFEVVSLESSFDKIVVQQTPGAKPNSYELQVKLAESEGLTFRNESISMTLKSASETVKENLPVRIYVSAPPRAPKVGEQADDMTSDSKNLKDFLKKQRERGNKAFTPPTVSGTEETPAAAAEAPTAQPAGAEQP